MQICKRKISHRFQDKKLRWHKPIKYLRKLTKLCQKGIKPTGFVWTTKKARDISIRKENTSFALNVNYCSEGRKTGQVKSLNGQDTSCWFSKHLLSSAQKNHSFQSITFMICLQDAKRRHKAKALWLALGKRSVSFVLCLIIIPENA